MKEFLGNTILTKKWTIHNLKCLSMHERTLIHIIFYFYRIHKTFYHSFKKVESF